MASDPKITKVTTFLMLGAFAFLFVIIILQWGATIYNSENSALTENDKAYVENLVGSEALDTNNVEIGSSVGSFNTSLYGDDAENPIYNDNSTNEKDFAIEFIWAKNVWAGIQKFLYVVFSLPSFVVSDLLQIPFGAVKFFAAFLNWVWRLFIVVAIIYAWRNR